MTIRKNMANLKLKAIRSKMIARKLPNNLDFFVRSIISLRLIIKNVLAVIRSAF